MPYSLIPFGWEAVNRFVGALGKQGDRFFLEREKNLKIALSSSAISILDFYRLEEDVFSLK
jgi:hypothetical protein